MGESVPIKGRCLRVNPQRKKMIMPDVILHTRNVMIPIVRPVSFKQSCDIPFSKNQNRHQILRAKNYRNNCALLFSETPLHTLYDPLRNSLEVKKIGHRKLKNQNTKHTIFGQTNFPSIKKTSISQNSYPLKRLSHKERNNALHFPTNTALVQSKPSTDDKDLHKASSRSIKLSRKCDLSQIKESQSKHKNIIAILPKIEANNNIVNKPVVSLPSQSFYNIVDTISMMSTQSMSSFKIENKKTFANIVNRKKSAYSIASNHPSNSEYEINVLHYENDILPENNIPPFAQSHLKSTNTDWSFAYNCSLAGIQNDNNNFANEKNAIKCHRYDECKTVNNIKYSWEIDDWVLPSQRKEHDNTHEIKITERSDKGRYDCKIKYSWQVIGTSTQTSYTLLQNLLNNADVEDNKSSYKMCSIKYSWQIIGISTQVSLHDYNDPDYWSGILLIPNKNYNENEADNNKIDHTKLQDYARYPKGTLKKYLILNNQQTQTFAEKEVQADPNDCYAKYSWHNLIKQYL